MLKPENLDDFSIDPAELEEYAEKARGMAGAWSDLARYAKLKAKAMRYRSAGRVLLAAQYEQDLEAIYRDLPEWARW